MKKSYKREFELVCIICGNNNFEFNTDKTWIKCISCDKEYNGGYDELIQLNQEKANNEIRKMQDEILKDADKELARITEKSLKRSKNLKYKK